MHYTIANMSDINFNQSINLDKSGNKYVVGLYNDDTKEYTHRQFDTIQEAYAIFERLAHCICFGEYSYNDRKSMLVQAA